MKKVCLISFEALPVPAVKGGAIETLVTSLVDQNEKKNCLDLTVVSPLDPQAHKEAQKYRRTRFVEIPKANKIRQFLFKCFHHIAQFWKTDYQLFPSLYYSTAFKKINNDDFDIVIFENGPYQGCRFFAERFQGKLWYHLHYVPDKDFTSAGFSRLIAISNFSAHRWQYHCSDSHMAISVIPNGIDAEKLQDTDLSHSRQDEMRSRLGFKKNDFVVLFCGRVIEQKGVRELMNAIQAISDPSVKLLIIGSSDFAPSSETSYTKEIRELAERLGDRVVFTGFVPNDQIHIYQQIADIQAVPSLWEEGAGLVCLEGMAAGLPLIVTRSGGMQEYVTNECALTVERDAYIEGSLRDAIIKLKDNDDMRKNMSRCARKRSKLFTVSKFYDNFVAICEETER